MLGLEETFEMTFFTDEESWVKSLFSAYSVQEKKPKQSSGWSLSHAQAPIAT